MNNNAAINQAAASKLDITNIRNFFSPKCDIMDNPYIAIQVHIRNMILTYGKEAFLEAVKQLSKDKTNEK